MSGQLLVVFFGGALGAVARYLVSQLLAFWSGSAWLYGTLTVNFVGSLLIGLAYAWIDSSISDLGMKAYWRGLVMVGFLGSFTTFSAFSLDVLLLLERGAWGMMLAYVAGMLILCFFAAFIGFKLGRICF